MLPYAQMVILNPTKCFLGLKTPIGHKTYDSAMWIVNMPPIYGMFWHFVSPMITRIFHGFRGFSTKNPRNLGFEMTTNPNQSYHAFGTLMMDGHAWWFGSWVNF